MTATVRFILNIFACTLLLSASVWASDQAVIQPLPEDDRVLIVGERPSDIQIIRWLKRPKNFSECIIKNVTPYLPEKMVEGLMHVCMTNFPKGSQSAWFKPRSIDGCYQKHQDKAGNKKAAGAIYVACQAYHQDVTNVSRY
ncbi:hypothetical protein SIN8267_02229 [Sinobacterium norvegicum]|uniref:Uncharacterized protein n=1 Tax=Sinobacterium norvegicum TaxID=1641715 RepID=A0ABM9AGJ5_9GAMM|nr:hypothetical protein [Sinobacterium norvegicum]CAH0992113.1 hypothetical protein SIN8267_02229 [Sinobacterium norvegicum]